MTNPIQDNTTDSGNTPDPRNENDKGSQQGTLNTSPATTNQASAGSTQNASKATADANLDKAVSNEKRQQDERNAPNTRSENKGGQQQETSREGSKQTQGSQQQQQPRGEEAKSDSASRAKQEATGAEEAKALSQPTPYKGKDSSAGQSESKSQREEGAKRTEGSGATSIPFTQTAPGDKLASEPGDMDDVAKNASQRYRDKYAEVMRDFHTGQLRGQSNQIIKGRDEAKAMAAEQAKHIDASAEQKGKQ